MTTLDLVNLEIKKTEKKLDYYEKVGIFNKKDELETLKNLKEIRETIKLVFKR